MRNYFPKPTSGAPLHTLTNYMMFRWFCKPPPILRMCIALLIYGRRRVALARYRMIYLVLIN